MLVKLLDDDVTRVCGIENKIAEVIEEGVCVYRIKIGDQIWVIHKAHMVLAGEDII